MSKYWRQEEKGRTEDEMVGWHHWLDGHEFERTLGAGDAQGSLACCSPWGRRVWHDWVTELNWTSLWCSESLLSETPRNIPLPPEWKWPNLCSWFLHNWSPSWVSTLSPPIKGSHTKLFSFARICLTLFPHLCFCSSCSSFLGRPPSLPPSLPLPTSSVH